MIKEYLFRIAIAVVAFLCGGLAIVKSRDFGLREREVALEDRFYDDCMFGPPVSPSADGSVPARPQRNSFAVCYSELIKARTVTSTSTLITGAPAPAQAAPAPAPPRR